jgi:membrane protein DedA with SNARE-associated domain
VNSLYVLSIGIISVLSIEAGHDYQPIFEYVPAQDSLDLKSLTQPADTSNIDDDSLEKLVPYLDEVEADTKNELVVIYMLLIAFSSFFSEDLAAIGAGLMSANGLIAFWPAAVGVIIGIFIGDFSLYFAGRWVGKPILKLAPFKWMVKEETLDASVKWFKTKGPYILFASRFIPGSRMPVYISAGILDTGFWTFLFYFGGTVLIWSPIFVWFSMIMGNELLSFYEAYDQYAIWVIVTAIPLFYALYKITPLLITTAGRRLLWKKLRILFQKS